MKKLINLIFTLSSLCSFSQKKISTTQALNIAGKQTMLCERLAKEKVYHVTNPNNLNKEHKLEVSLIQFERNISRLKNMEAPQKTSFLITTIEMLWFTYKKSIVDKDHISTIKTMEYNKILFHHCELLFNDLLSQAKKEKSYPYNTANEDFHNSYIASNKVKYLSQKLSLYYNVYYAKVHEYDHDYFNSIFLEIDASIATLNKLKHNSSLIEEKTIKIENDWQALKLEIKESNKTNFQHKENYPKPEYILTKNNELLKDADLLTRYYKEQNEIN